MQRSLATLSLLLTLALPTLAQDPAKTTLSDLCARFTDYDNNSDNQVEITSIAPLSHANAADPAAPAVLVLVESRILAPLDAAPDLRPIIDRFVNDIAADGFTADALSVQLFQSDLHQDGRFLIALREFTRAYNSELRPLDALILVGHFPDVCIVRTCNWRKQEDLTLHRGEPGERTYANATFVRRVPEIVARRGDIMLADLDGRWEDIYVQPRTSLDTVYAVFPDGIPAHGGACADLEESTVTCEDFFHVSDGRLEISQVVNADNKTTGYYVALFDDSGDLECSDADRARPNVIARPEIMVSRIDTRGIALNPDPAIAGIHGEHLLDDAGQPQNVQFASSGEVPHWRNSIWKLDPVFERRLLVDFFDRNHAYRTGQAQIAWRPSSISCGLGSGYRIMQRAADHWIDDDPAQADLGDHATLAQVVDWLRYPAILRTIRAHSDDWGSVFATSDTDELDAALHGPAWSWTPEDDKLVPSLGAACGGGKFDYFLLRSMWENNALAPQPAFYHHTGCDATSPPGSTDRAYDAPDYDIRQGGEALLFFGNGLALVGRSKVFYDEPRGFTEALRDGRTFGQAWKAYFEIESRGPTWQDVGGDIGRKRACFWSLLGDPTLRLVPPKTR